MIICNFRSVFHDGSSSYFFDGLEAGIGTIPLHSSIFHTAYIIGIQKQKKCPVRAKNQTHILIWNSQEWMGLK